MYGIKEEAQASDSGQHHSNFRRGEKFAFDLRNLLSGRFKTSFTNPVSKLDIVREDTSKLLKQFGIPEGEIHDIKCHGVMKKAFGNQDYVLMIPKPAGLARLASAVKHSDVVYCITNNPFLLFFSVFYAKIYGRKLIFGVQQPLFAKIFKSGGFPTFCLQIHSWPDKALPCVKRIRTGACECNLSKCIDISYPGVCRH